MVKLLHVCYKKALYSSNLLVTSFQDYKARKNVASFFIAFLPSLLPHTLQYEDFGPLALT
jgi:hypothetical protein